MEGFVMKKIQKFVAIFLAIILIVSAMPIYAANDVTTSNRAAEVHWRNKISAELWSVMEDASYDELIPVWVWFSDIDQNAIDRQVEKDTGLTIDNLSVSNYSVSDELLEMFQAFSRNDEQQSFNNDLFVDYLSRTELQRAEERRRTDDFIRARRHAARDAYVSMNTALIAELNLPQENITFQSELTPSVIVDLSADQILDVAQSANVVGVYFHCDNVVEPNVIEPMSSNPPNYVHCFRTMRVDEAQSRSGLTGNGVNVVMIDHGMVRSDAENFDWVLYPGNIKAVHNKEVFDVTNPQAIPVTAESNNRRANQTAGLIQRVAKDVNIYSVGHGAFSDLEWVLLLQNETIHLINGNVIHSGSPTYDGNPRARWFDAIVSSHNVALIASVGDEGNQVTSPAKGFNSIAVGAFSAGIGSEPDRMHNSNFGPTSGTALVNFKPDLVAASNHDTGGATAKLTGITAMMVELRPSLSSTPELIKAILLASCHRKVAPFGNTPSESIWHGLTQRQGAGAVDALRALGIVLNRTYAVEYITSGTEKFFLTGMPDSSNFINVSMAWLRNNTTPEGGNIANTTLGTIQEFDLSLWLGPWIPPHASQTRNSGKQMIYFIGTDIDSEIHVTKVTQNSTEVRFAYAWSTECMQHDLMVTMPNLTFNGSTYAYSQLQFYNGNRPLIDNPINVVVRRRNSSGIVATSPTYLVTNGQLNSIASSVRNFNANEYIEVLISEPTTQTVFHREFFRPTTFIFN